MDQFAAWFERHYVTLMPVLFTLILLIAASIAIMLVKGLLRNLLKRIEVQIGLSVDTAIALTRVITGALWVITAVLILEVWGVSVSGLWALLASAAATVIGLSFLATWAIISNTAASLSLSIWRPFRLGDAVGVLPEAMKGRVVDRNLMFVVLREQSGNIIQIPNNLFFQKMFRISGREDQSQFEAIERSDVRSR
jgi:small-conductance mechanosensitive channel